MAKDEHEPRTLDLFEKAEPEMPDLFEHAGIPLDRAPRHPHQMAALQAQELISCPK